jgi:hypothetical protein
MKRIALLTSVLALTLAAAGCSGGTAAQNDNGASQTAASAMTKAPVAPQVKSPHVRLVADALADVPLRAEQRTENEQQPIKRS